MEVLYANLGYHNDWGWLGGDIECVYFIFCTSFTSNELGQT